MMIFFPSADKKKKGLGSNIKEHIIFYLLGGNVTYMFPMPLDILHKYLNSSSLIHPIGIE